MRHVESLKRKYGVSMQVVSYQSERPCSEIEASVILCRYYLGVQVAVKAAEAAVEAAKGDVYWRDREWRMVKARRKRVLAAEEKAAAAAAQAAREEVTPSERERREFTCWCSHCRTRVWQRRVHKRGVKATEEQEGQQQQRREREHGQEHEHGHEQRQETEHEQEEHAHERARECARGVRVASEAAARGLELAESRDEAWAYKLERRLAKKRRKKWGERNGGWRVRETPASPPRHEQEQEQRQPVQNSLIARLLLSLLVAVEEWGKRGRGGGEGKKRARGRSRSRSESRENSGDAVIETKRRRQAREGRHCEAPLGSRHQVAHWGNVAGRRKGDPRDRGPKA